MPTATRTAPRVSQLKHVLSVKIGTHYRASTRRYCLIFEEFAGELFYSVTSQEITPSGYLQGDSNITHAQNVRIKKLPRDFDAFLREAAGI